MNFTENTTKDGKTYKEDYFDKPIEINDYNTK